VNRPCHQWQHFENRCKEQNQENAIKSTRGWERCGGKRNHKLIPKAAHNIVKELARDKTLEKTGIIANYPLKAVWRAAFQAK